jgi:hypothetical protein
MVTVVLHQRCPRHYSSIPTAFFVQMTSRIPKPTHPSSPTTSNPKTTNMRRHTLPSPPPIHVPRTSLNLINHSIKPIITRSAILRTMPVLVHDLIPFPPYLSTPRISRFNGYDVLTSKSHTNIHIPLSRQLPWGALRLCIRHLVD